MKRFFICFVSFVLVLVSMAQQRSYDEQLRYMYESPRTVIKESQVAMNDAIKKHHSPEMIDALMLLSGAKLLLDSDSIAVVINEVEHTMNRCSNKVDRSVIALYLCDVYNAHLANNYYRYERASYIKGNSDIATWSVQNFYDKVDSLHRVALQHTRALQKTPITRYRNIIAVEGYEGNNAEVWLEKFYPTMYDFVASVICKNTTDRRMQYTQHDVESIIAVMRDAMQYHQKRREYAPQMMWELKYLQYDYLLTNNSDNYILALEHIIDQYSRFDFVIEAVIERYSHTLFQATNDVEAEYHRLLRWIDKYPHYYRIGCLQSMCADLTAASVSLSIPQVVHPIDRVVAHVTYSNVEHIVCELWRSNITRPLHDMSNLSNDKMAWKLCDSHTIVCQGIDFIEHTQKVDFASCPAGLYRMTVASGNKKDEVFFVVSPYMLLSIEATPEEAFSILVDNKSGNPVEGEKIVLTSRTGTVLQQSTTDAQGVCRFIKPAANATYNIHLADFSQYPFQQNLTFVTGTTDKENIEGRIFTDRSLYRPGQTLQFGAIVYRLDSSLRQVLSHCDVQAKLYDNGGNEVWSETFTTDSYGSIHGEINLPEVGLLGSWRLSIRGENFYASQYIEVAEYKRPQFVVECNAIQGIYSYGDSIQMTGSAMNYSGAPVAFAQVEYVVRQHSYMYGAGTIVARGTTSTQVNGDFAFAFVAAEAEQPMARRWGTRYIAEIIVTSPTGESQQSDAVVVVSGDGVKFSCNIPSEVCRDATPQFAVSVINGAGVEQQLPYTLSLYRTLCDEVGSNEYRRSIDELWHTQGAGHENTLLLPYENMSSGSYRLLMSARTPSGEQVTDSIDFVCYSAQDKRPPVPVELWLPIDRFEVENGNIVSVAVGSALQNASLYYFVSSGDEAVCYNLVSLDNSMTTVDVPFDASCNDVVQVMFVLVHNKVVHRQRVVICRKQPDSHLRIIPTTFRNKTLPGSRETWRFIVRDAAGNPVDALFMAEMYDASLDALRTHSWYFNPQFTPYARYMLSVDYQWFMTTIDHAHIGYRNDFIEAQYVSSVYPMLQNYLLTHYGYLRGGMAFRTMAQGAQLNKNSIEMDMACTEEMVDISSDKNDAEHDTERLSMQAVEYRNEMPETAFFYPHMVTDSDGNVCVEFTMPESNTTWNFLSLAVTPQLQSSMYTATVVSSKPLMVQPNLPRFVRQGDKMMLSASIFNMTDEAMSGEVQFTLYNPENESDISVESKPFVVPAQASITVQFMVDIPRELSLVGVRVGATTPLYSDGEQHLLPVLPSTMVVTDSKPFYIAPSVSDTTIIFDSMHHELEHDDVQSLRATLEYCDNPAWYAVMALPSLSQPSDNSAISLMASLYANVVATGIVAQNRTIAQALLQWSKQAEGVALVSPLEQNEELKQLLLNETPWLLEANDATAQLKQIASLLDTHRAKKLSDEAASQLRDMQQSDGGWSWYKGMQSSFTITLNIVAGLSRMIQWGDVGNTEQMAMMKIDALRYLDAEYLRRNGKQSEQPDYQDLCYLYVRSAMHDVPMSAEVLALYHRQLDSIAQLWYKFDEIEKAYAAIALYRTGYAQTANDIIESLREYAVISPIQGMYWPNNRSYSYYRNSAVQVQCAIYEAFSIVSPRKTELDAMRQWILLQKQTQAWDNVPTTLDAVNILLMTGCNWLSHTPSARIVWGEKPLPAISEAEQIMGYEKYVREGDSIVASDAIVSILQHTDQPSWGAIYWQYSTAIDNIEAHGTDELSVERNYFVERNGALVAIENTDLQVGDVLTVRITMRTTRDMQYMVLTDARPACFEPQEQLPQYNYVRGIYYYSVPSDAANYFYIEYMPRGVYVIEYKVYVDREGTFSAGISTLQNYFAPQFTSHTAGKQIQVRK